jgi:isopentenyl-diphosphate delta-isomerase
MTSDIEEKVILVDQNDKKIGLMPKMEAHEKGVLHRAFSVFVFNDKDELLIQQRAVHKYHSPLLWANTCCSHQRDGESNEAAAKRRLQEEMGFSCELKEKTTFIYKAHFDNGLIEHEYDHIFIGTSNQNPQINPDEVASYQWVTLEDLKKGIKKHPENYAAWFKIIFERVW